MQSLSAGFPKDALDRLGFDQIVPGFYATGPGAASQRYAWLLPASFNPQNTHGLYEGAKPYHFYFLGDRLVATAFPERVWNGRAFIQPYNVTEFGGGGLDSYRAGFDPETSSTDG